MLVLHDGIALPDSLLMPRTRLAHSVFVWDIVYHTSVGKKRPEEETSFLALDGKRRIRTLPLLPSGKGGEEERLNFDEG
jgi:hypothetical protein